MTPCTPKAVHTAETLNAWAVWRSAHPAWKAAVVIAVGCSVAGGVAAARELPALLAPTPAAPAPYGGLIELTQRGRDVGLRDAVPVPEPSGFLVFGVALVALGWLRARR